MTGPSRYGRQRGRLRPRTSTVRPDGMRDRLTADQPGESSKLAREMAGALYVFSRDTERSEEAAEWNQRWRDE